MLEDYGCRFHHLGVACRDIGKEAEVWSMLGYSAEGGDYVDPIQRVNIRFMTGPGPRLELISPAFEASPIEKIIEQGHKIYHQAFTTPRLDELVEALGRRRCRPVSDPAPAVAFGGRRVVFILMTNMNLVEFIEGNNNHDSRSPN